MSVFTSKISLNDCNYLELYELIEPKAAVPVLEKKSKPQIIHSLLNKTQKTYVSKRTSKRKVKTVGDIRKEYEQQISEKIMKDLEEQHNYFSECVGNCTFKEEHVLDHIKHILTSTSPIMRSTWPILTNVNIENYSYPRQYVLWKGKTILLHGSTGGSTEYLYNFATSNDIEQQKVIQNIDFPKNIQLKSISDKSNNQYGGPDKLSDPMRNEEGKEMGGDIGVKHILDNLFNDEDYNIKYQATGLNKNSIDETFQYVETELRSLNLNKLQYEKKRQPFKLCNTLECSCDYQNNNSQENYNCNCKTDFDIVGTTKKQASKLTENSECLSIKWLHARKTEECLKSSTGRLKEYLHQHNLSVHLVQLNCTNIEPLCMEHELYRCFCMGKFSTKKFSKNTCPATPSEAVDDVPNSIHTEKLFSRENMELEKENIDKSCEPVENNSVKTMDSVNDLSIFTTSNIKNEDKNNKYEHILKCLLHTSDDEIKTEIINIKIDECNKQSAINNQTVLSDDITDSSQSASQERLLQCQREPQTLLTSKKTKLDTTKQRFSSWINNEYNRLIYVLAKGVKITLRKPCPNKMMLIPYSDLLQRYKLRKNVFLVNRDYPNQVHIVIDPKHEDFKHLVNVDRINIEELYRHCDFLKHLRLNTPLKEKFVFLKGFLNSWEIVGLVSKCNDTTEITLPSTRKSNITTDHGNVCNFENITTNKEKQTGNMDNNLEMIKHRLASSSENVQPNQPSLQSDTITSTYKDMYDFGNQVCKWYYMVVGNDFVEMQISNKKMFVKYTEIISTIDIARSSNKPLYITNQRKKSLQNKEFEFGIYINPHLPKNHMLIGPYEEHEELCIILVHEPNVDQQNNETSKESVGICVSTEKMYNGFMINSSLPVFVELQNVIARGVKRKMDYDVDNMQFSEKKMKSSNVVAQPESAHTSEMHTLKTMELAPHRSLSEQITFKVKHTEGLNIFKPISRLRNTFQDLNYIEPINKSQFYQIPRYPIITAVGTLVETNTNNSCEKSQSDAEMTKKSAQPEIEKDNLTPVYSTNKLEISDEVELATDTPTPLWVHTDEKEISADFNIGNNHSKTSGDTKLGAEISKTHSSHVNTEQQISKIIKDSCQTNSNKMEIPAEDKIEKNHSRHTHSKIINICADSEIGKDNSALNTNSDKMNMSSYIEKVKVNPNIESHKVHYESVKIVCINVENFGYLNGRRDCKNDISFQYPYSDEFSFYYYNKHYAFKIINKYFNKHMYIQKPLQLEWKMVNDEDESEIGNLCRILPKVVFSHIITNNGKLIKTNSTYNVSST